MAMQPSPVAVPSRPWYANVTRYQWLVLLIASLGWIFDVFEGQIFSATRNSALNELLGAAATPELIAYYNKLALAAFLVGGAAGGIGFGVLSDRIGRVRTMMLTIIMYSCFTCLTAFARTADQVVLLRLLVSMGVGGEWAVASAMVAEVFPKEARAWSLGIFHASSIFGLYAAVAAGTWVGGHPSLGWRWCYAVGLLPALLTIWIYASLREPEAWLEARLAAREGRARAAGRLFDLFHSDLRRQTLVGLSLATVGLATFWGVYMEGQNLVYEMAQNQRLPADARELRGAERQAAVRALPADSQRAIHRAEMAAMFLVSSGGGLGLISFGPVSNRTGRRGAFGLFCVVGLACSLLLFLVLPAGPRWMLWAFLPVFGFFATGMHAGYAIYFPELFPTRLRGTGSGFCFNGGRLWAAPILFISGWMQRDLQLSISTTASIMGLLFLLGVALLPLAPETRDKDLPT